MSMRSRWLIDKSEAVSRGAMVTAMHPLAAEVGAQILERGGSAIDAAIATAFAIGVVEPFMSGVGGIAFLVYRDAATGQTVCFDGSSVLPAAIRPEMFELLDPSQRTGMYMWRATRDDANNTGWLSPAVPGMPALMQDAHRRYGRLPWRELLQPAIRLAAEGFEVDFYVGMFIAANYERLHRCETSRRTFYKPSGAPLSPSTGFTPGDRLVQTDLARTLRLIAEEGADVVYRGEIARLIVEDMRRHGGLIAEADLAAHRTVIHDRAAQVTYRDCEIYGQLENSGYATVVEAMNILEGFDVRRLGAQSVEAEHLIVEAVRRSFLDRLRFLGDSRLMPVPYQGMTSKAFADTRRATIDPGRATPNASHGDPWPFDAPEHAWVPARASAAGEGMTTHITVVDRDRNLVSLTSTLGMTFGSGVVVEGTGICLNNGTCWFDPEPGSVTSIGPGKRILSAASPVLVSRGGRPWLALGSPGGRRVISAVYQCLVNAIDFGLGMQAAVSAPRVHAEGPDTLISNRFPGPVIDGLRSLGHAVTVCEDDLGGGQFARPSGIMVDDRSGEVRGGVFQFTPATAVGI
jgi:gamma-glutamyltranspeptidase / glutathione hydrolase